MQKYNSSFTIDVECGISITMRDSYGIELPPTERVVENTHRILSLLEEKNTKATFFVLGVVAEHFPDLISDISKGGHEIGVHGYHHFEFFKISPEKAFQEVDRAKKLLEDISGNRVYGHRAPAFSINEETRWGLDVVANAGFVYDSSVIPIKSERYGWPGFDDDISELETREGKTLVEVPLSVTKFLKWEIPACGGRYLQILPYSMTRNAFIKKSQTGPAIVYMHPYEIDESTYPDYYYEQLRKAGLKKRFKTYVKWINRGSFYHKIEKLVTEFQFTPLIEIVKEFQELKKVG